VIVDFTGADLCADLMKRYEDLGVSRVVFNLESEKADKNLPIMDGWAKLMRQVNG